MQTKPIYQFDSKIFDGSAVVHFLPTSSVITFADYANEPFLIHQLENTNRVDCVWDGYIDCSIKESTRICRGTGLRTKDSGGTKLPRKLSVFLRVAANKKELFHFLTGKVEALMIPASKMMFITSEDKLICKGTDRKMQRNRSKNAKI